MSDWYVSSVAYAAIPQWTNGHVYAAGAIVRQLAAVAAGNERCFRTAAGLTSGAAEPAWNLNTGTNTTDNGGTWTEVTGNSTYFWSAAGARFNPFLNAGASRAIGGDRIFVSSDHAETSTSSSFIVASNSSTWVRAVSVNRGGSTPPVAADITTGAAVTIASVTPGSAMTLGNNGWDYFEGFTFTANGNGTSNALSLNAAQLYLKNCALVLSNVVGQTIQAFPNGLGNITLDNTTVQFGNAGQKLTGVSSSGRGTFLWKNTASAIQGPTTSPTTLISIPYGNVILRGVDLSATAGNLIDLGGADSAYVTVSDCKVSAAASLTVNSMNVAGNTCDFINVDSGATGYKNSWMRYQGTISTETTLLRSGGASDGVQAVSHKYVSNTTPVKSFPLIGPDYYVWNAKTGSAVTATLEILSGAVAPLNNDDVWLELEYLGSAGAPLSSFGNDMVATILSSNAAQTASTHIFSDWAADCFNPVVGLAGSTNFSLSASNRTLTKTAAAIGGAPALCYFSSGKVYWEMTLGSVPGAAYVLGFCAASQSISTGNQLGTTTVSLGYFASAGTVKINGATLSTIQTAGNGDVVGLAVDLTNNHIWIRKNGGNWNNDVIGNQNPATNTGGISLTTLTGGPYAPAFTDTANSSVVTLNGGSSAFNAAAPSGFAAVNSGTTQKLTVSFTPQLAGLVRAQVKFAKASSALWVDPLLSVA